MFSAAIIKLEITLFDQTGPGNVMTEQNQSLYVSGNYVLRCWDVWIMLVDRNTVSCDSEIWATED